MGKGFTFTLPPMSRQALTEIRRDKTRGSTRFSVGGAERKKQKPRPITLRRPKDGEA